MTRATNARIAGITFLLYIAAGLTSLAMSAAATRGEGIAEKLASITQNTTEIGVVVLLTLIANFCAVVLGVTLYGITREEDSDIAMLGLLCRVIEGIPTGVALLLGQLWLATSAAGRALDPIATQAAGAVLFLPHGATIAGIFFAVGSTSFSWLLFRGRMVPVALARLGVFASALLVVILPLQLAGFTGQAGFIGTDMNWFAAVTWLVWLPMLVYEIWLGLWLIIKGAAAPSSQSKWKASALPVG